MQVLTPCVQNGHDADIGSEVLGIGSNDGEGFGGSLEQQAIDDRLVLVGDPAKHRRQLEHQVKIRHGKELGFARRKPCRCRLRLALSAVPVAAGNGQRPLAVLWANSVMGSWRPAQQPFWPTFECFCADQSPAYSPLQRSHRDSWVARAPFGFTEDLFGRSLRRSNTCTT